MWHSAPLRFDDAVARLRHVFLCSLTVQWLAGRRLFPLLFPIVAVHAQLAQYDRTLNNLSEPPAARWQHFAAPYFSTNEKLLNRFYSRFDNAGGATVGVSFQQNLSLLVHARPQLCVIFDYNPGVTEILVPFMGGLIAANPTRREFLSSLLGASFTEDETKNLLEGRAPTSEVLAEVLERSGAEKRKERIAHLRDLFREKYLERLPALATPSIRSQALKWIDILENEELLTGNFFADAIAPYRMSKVAADQARMAGWLSTEENYAMVRSYWTTGRIIGVTGDISGPSVARLASYLRDRHMQVSTLYISNVGLSVEGHFPEIWFRDLYRTLTELPVTPQTLTLIAHGPWQLTGFVRSLRQAQWVYQTLADVPEQTVIRLHEAPLEVLTQLGPTQFLPSIHKGLAAIHAPQPYSDLLQQVQIHLSDVRGLNCNQFDEWSVKRVKGVDLNSAVYRTMMVALTEGGLLAGPQSSGKSSM